MDLSSLPNLLDKKTCECRAIVETPKGRRNKFDYDPQIEAFKLGGLLAEGLSFPFDFGFVPSTLAEDGDPVDVMVLMDEPAHVGCVLDVRIIGVIEAEQTEDGKTVSNHRLVAVAIHSYNHQHKTTLSQVNKSTIEQVEEFFITYNKSRGKKFRILGNHGPKRALKLLQQGIDAYERSK
jgi:inorganic pyrophosphatase